MNNIIFIYGEDSYTALKHLQAIKAKYTEVQTGDLNLADLEAVNLTVDELSRQIRALPFLAKKRLVIVRNILSKNKVLAESLPEILKHVPETTILILYDTVVDKRTSPFKNLIKLATVKAFPLLEIPALNNWIRKFVTGLGGTIDSSAINLLVDWVGPDLWQLSQELTKLVTYNPAISTESVQLLVPANPQTIIFKLNDELLGGTLNNALSILDRLRAQGEADLYLFSLLAGSYRSLIKIALAQKEGAKNSFEIKDKTKLHPFVIQKSIGFLKKISLKKLVEHYRYFVDVDFAIKTGKMESGPALDLLLVNLKQTAPLR